MGHGVDEAALEPALAFFSLAHLRDGCVGYATHFSDQRGRGDIRYGAVAVLNELVEQRVGEGRGIALRGADI